MPRAKQGGGTRWRSVSVAAFLVGFVFIREITPTEEARMVADAALALAALGYAAGLFLLGREGGGPGRALREFLALGGALMLVVFSSPAAEYLAQPLLVRPDVDRAEAIVVLGGGVHLNGSLTAGSLERTLYGAALYRRGMAPHVIFSGGVVRDAPRAEAEAMAELAGQLGVPKEAMLLERASGTTYENAVEVVRLMRKRGLRRALLVTSATHMYRSQLAFRRQGVEVLPAPVQTREGLRYALEGRRGLFYGAIHEYGGLVWYKLRGRI